MPNRHRKASTDLACRTLFDHTSTTAPPFFTKASTSVAEWLARIPSSTVTTRRFCFSPSGITTSTARLPSYVASTAPVKVMALGFLRESNTTLEKVAVPLASTSMSHSVTTEALLNIALNRHIFAPIICGLNTFPPRMRAAVPPLCTKALISAAVWLAFVPLTVTTRRCSSPSKPFRTERVLPSEKVTTLSPPGSSVWSISVMATLVPSLPSK